MTDTSSALGSTMAASSANGDHQRRVALAVTTVGILAATLNSSILLISLPAIFDGLGLDPLAPANVSLLLWMMMGYLLATAVLVLTFGRMGDQHGRAKLFNLGFLIFTIASVGCALVPSTGTAGAWELIGLRIVQGVGGAMLTANSTAIITDAFPAGRRGFALGVNQVAGLAGSFLGLVVGGLLATWHWRSVFWISVPVGIWGTWMGYRTLRDRPGSRRPGRIDWWGNVTFGLGLILVLIAITYGLQPFRGQIMGWTSPAVLTGLIGGAALLVAFCLIETRVKDPMVNLRLFRIRAFAAGNLVNLFAAMARGGLQFMLIIWLQGIWLPLHGYSFESTPLWAGIYMLPMTLGFLIAGPVSGALSDRFGARIFATGGLLLMCASFMGLILIPANFSYPLFAVLLALNGIGSGLLGAPNTAAIMNSVPAAERGQASGIRATGMNAGMVVSMGGFFTLMAIGLSHRLPAALTSGLTALGVHPDAAAAIGQVPPVGTLFAAFLGQNPIVALMNSLDPAQLQPGHGVDLATLEGREFFPQLISGPFQHGLVVAFTVAVGMLLLATVASLARGKKFVHADAHGTIDQALDGLAKEGAALEVPAIPRQEIAYAHAAGSQAAAEGNVVRAAPSE